MLVYFITIALVLVLCLLIKVGSPAKAVDANSNISLQIEARKTPYAKIMIFLIFAVFAFAQQNSR